MPAPRWLARFNRHATNPLLGRLATRVPAFGVVIHRGRKTGHVYRTPVNVFRRPGGYVVALTYGSSSEWVRNVLAGGGCRLETRGRTMALGHPRVLYDPRRRAVPAPVRFVLGLLHVNHFLDLRLENPV
jgi:deazaflavin-dependent oxidoreductase (nitroreductase family)